MLRLGEQAFVGWRLAAAACGGAAEAATHVVGPGRSVQEAIDGAADGDVIVLNDGVYHEALDIRRSITLKAAHPGEATVTNKHPEALTWTAAPAGSGTWYDWPKELDRRWGGLAPAGR